MSESAAYWDEKYAARDDTWDAEPNPRLPGFVVGLTPGHALEIGCGEGSDAVWLAARGWTVEAVDLSQVALDRGRDAAETRGLGGAITWRQADVLAWAPDVASYDFVISHFVHFPWPEQADYLRNLARAVRPGGRLVVVGHDPSDLATGLRRPPTPGLLHTAEAVAGLLQPAEWAFTTCGALPRTARTPEGRIVPIHDATVVATRR